MTQHKKILAPQKGRQELMLNVDADVIFLGGAAGSSKSYTLLLRMIRYMKDPYFRGIYFRRTSVQLQGAGGLWTEFQDMYRDFKPKYRQRDMEAVFNSGCSVKFMHMEHTKNRFDHQGLQYSAIFWDELSHFEEEQFTYLLSRLRSAAEGDSFTMASMNPDCDSWIMKYVSHYLTEDGYFNEDMLGVVTYFIMIDGDPVFAKTREELIEQYPDYCKVYDPNTKTYVDIKPKSFIFVGATIFDNPLLIKSNPNYLAELKALPPTERARLLEGNWFAREEGSKFWKREWVRGEQGERVKSYRDVPNSIHWYRGVDKGYSVPSEKNRYPDPTSISPQIGKDHNGFYWILGNYCSQVFDDDQKLKSDNQKIYGSFKKLAGERDDLLIKQAIYDGDGSSIVLTKDLGAGTTDHNYTKAKLVGEGIHVVEDKSPKNTPDKKIKDFLPFCNACELGLVYIVEESFNKATLEAWYKELESFDGEKSTGLRKDDRVDSTAIGFSAAASKRSINIVTRNQKKAESRAAELLNNHSVSIENKETLKDKGVSF